MFHVKHYPLQSAPQTAPPTGGASFSFSNGNAYFSHETLVPSIDKDTHGFDGQKNAHAASKPLSIHKVLPAGFSLPERFSAPAKLLAPDSFGFFE